MLHQLITSSYTPFMCMDATRIHEYTAAVKANRDSIILIHKDLQKFWSEGSAMALKLVWDNGSKIKIY